MNMKRNLTLLGTLLLASALCLTACGESSSAVQQQDTPDTAEASVSEAAEESSESSAEEAEPAEEPAPENDAFIIDWGGISLRCPSTFQQRNSIAVGAYGGATEHNSDVLFLYLKDGYYKAEHEGETYTAADVQEILRKQIYRQVSDYCMTGEEYYDYTVDSEEEIEVLGQPFVLRKGITRCNIGDSSETALHYVGCYGVIDLENLGEVSVPFAWAAYSADDSEEAVAELEEIVRNAARDAQFS